MVKVVEKKSEWPKGVNQRINFGGLCLGQKGLERNVPFIFNHVMHCDLEQELGQVLGGQVTISPLNSVEGFSHL